MTTPLPDPFRIASAVWQDLCDYQPGAAAALTIQLKNMPEDWPLRVFNVGRPDAAVALPPAAVGEVFDDMRPEIPPYAEHSFDECPACIEADDNCRYHQGYATGHHEALQAELDAVKADPAITLKDFLQRQADSDEQPAV
ncbi:hypothetical protein ACFWHG_05725 [Streptomyces microflavus]|uniref:hypothetical protein n=1 Tax=Streptomyces microflavus TaxID=1919 RepID=UPI0036472BC4